MPIFDFKCPECDFEELDIPNQEASRICFKCGAIMGRLFPTRIHTKMGTSVDSKDSGAVTREKNEQLKKREDGYGHETGALRDKIEKQVKERQK
jgi:predicted nucleic acid-binding Zn ribbon protein